MNFINKVFLSITTFACVLAFGLAAPRLVLADNTTDICAGVEVASGQACDVAGGGTKVSSIVRTAIRILQTIAGLLAVFYLIYAGIKFITSSGGSDGVKSAKNTIIYSSIGIVIVIIAEAIIRFVLDRFN